MIFKIPIHKVTNKLWSKLVQYTRNTPLYICTYRSYWHYLFYKRAKQENNTCYFSARPNPGAGIGHQMANWIAGYWWAKQFGLPFAHIPFSTPQWETFLGFGAEEKAVSTLLEEKYKMVRLPLFDQFNSKEIDRTRQIIHSYSGGKNIIVCEQDQGYMEQFGVMEDIQYKFHSALSRKNDKLIFSKSNFNIAIHVRRGDIMSDSKNPNLQIRYVSNDYFKNILDQVLTKYKTTKPIHIYFFSQGQPDNFCEFHLYKNLHWCFDMSDQDSFLHMVFADLLITSKSSFSYKPALLNRGIKVCPKDFWHGYPETKDWILADENGNFKLKIIQ